MLDIHCDGAYKDGIGAYAYAIYYQDNKLAEGAGIVPHTHYNSNNLAELTAIIEAITAIPLEYTATVYTDSIYCTNGIKNINKVLKGRYPEAWVRLYTLLQCGRYQVKWLRDSNKHPRHRDVDSFAKSTLAYVLTK